MISWNVPRRRSPSSLPRFLMTWTGPATTWWLPRGLLLRCKLSIAICEAYSVLHAQMLLVCLFIIVCVCGWRVKGIVVLYLFFTLWYYARSSYDNNHQTKMPYNAGKRRPNVKKIWSLLPSVVQNKWRTFQWAKYKLMKVCLVGFANIMLHLHW